MEGPVYAAQEEQKGQSLRNIFHSERIVGLAIYCYIAAGRAFYGIFYGNSIYLYHKMKVAAWVFKKGPVIILCLVAMAANFGLNTLVEKVFRQPLFLDTLFTAAVTFTAGLVPGLITAVLTTLFFGVLRYHFFGTYLYVLCSIALVIIVWLFRGNFCFECNDSSPEEYRFLRFQTMVNLLALAALLCGVISLMGGLINYFNDMILRLKDYDHSPELNFKLALMRNNIPFLLSAIFARIPVNIVDRIITVYGAYGIAQGLKKTRLFS
jgi:hypothetical protein